MNIEQAVHHQSDENVQTDNAEHEECMQDASNYRAVPLGTDKEGDWMIRGHFYAESANRV